ncbi:hypothetical protein OIO90_001318 [Microbotryomycetes sp. JL221]|nr:hypothetical protein OIO90_001318 [Microbotryomycetes sp. JL221]
MARDGSPHRSRHYDDDRAHRRRSRSPRRDRDDDRDDSRHYSSSRRDSKRSRHDDEHDDERRDRYTRDSDRKRRKDDAPDRDRDDDDGRHRRGRDEHKSSKSHKHRETSAERAARKAERKAQKQADAALLLPQEARLAAAETSYYSAQDNPFNDANLADKFIWGKKREKERKMGMTPDEAAKRDMQRRIDSQQEIDKLNQRRAQREEEEKLREEEALRAQRMQESAYMAAWIDKEDDFHLEQAKRRAEIRVRERRAKPIDYLALNLKWSQPPLQPGDEGYDEHAEQDDGAGLEVDLDEPYAIFDNLTLEDAEELHEDIKMYLSLEKAEQNLEFWRSLLIVSSATLEALREERAIGHSAYAAQRRANAAVKDEITALLAGKTFDQLVALQSQVQRKLASGEPVDVDYWEGLLKELIVWKAKAKLRDMHEIVLQNRLEQLRKKQRDEALKMKEDLQHALGVQRQGQDAGEDVDGAQDDEMAVVEDDRAQIETVAAPWDEALEPPLLSKLPDDYKNLPVVDPQEQWHQLIEQRRKIVSTRFVAKRTQYDSNAEAGSSANKDDEIYRAAVGQGINEEEELFNLEVEMARQSYSWEDKYRPRKPRYFNKVHTGYEWNKYNQTHYDSDNPPPKVVQGYKFNIFYPDLIDKSKAPQFRIIRNKKDDETATLLFSAGPPYEDIAFQVVNKPWERSHKRGFRSTFDRGVLQLHFNFQRQFYRK